MNQCTPGPLRLFIAGVNDIAEKLFTGVNVNVNISLPTPKNEK